MTTLVDFVAVWATTKGFHSWIVDYVADRGTWKLEKSQEINAALDSYPINAETFDALADRQPPTLIVEGAAVLRWIELNLSGPVGFGVEEVSYGIDDEGRTIRQGTRKEIVAAPSGTYPEPNEE